MTQDLKIKIAGLYTYNSDISSVPDGALSQADNIIVDRAGEAEPRRGFGYLTHEIDGYSYQSAFSDPLFRAEKIFFYQDQTLAHYGALGSPTHLAYNDGYSSWLDYSGSYSSPSATNKMRSTQANQNFYFTTSTGVYKLDAYNSVPSVIGAPPALDLEATTPITETPTGNTSNTSKTISSLSSTTGLAIGMQVTGTGIPSNTLIVSIGTTTMVLSNAATATNTGTTLTCSPPSTWLPSGYSVGYRVVWGIQDKNSNVIEGAVSQTAVITNVTSSNIAVVNTFSIPSGITTAHFYQIYRSANAGTAPTPPATSAGFITPSDELQLVYEGNPLTGDISKGYISVVDIVPDGLRGAALYTNASQEGLANSNVPAPFCLDLAVFKNVMFFANTIGLQGYSLSLLGTGVPSGIQSGDTVTIGGIVYTADTSENTSTGHFKVSQVFVLNTTATTTSTSATLTSVGSVTGVIAGMTVTGVGIPAGSYVVSTTSNTIVLNQACTSSNSGESIQVLGDSAAEAINDTALSLVKVVNRYASSTVYAYYLSTASGLPGQMLFQSRAPGASSFAVISSRGTCWTPSLPTSGTTQSSTNDTWKNGLFYSKVSEPEAVPLANYYRVGSADKSILRVIALRDSLFILKEDGIFRLYGTDPTNFQITALDYTALLIAPETAQSLNNMIYALTTQGIVAISESGVQIMSQAIKEDISSLVSENYTVLRDASFGVAYESDRAYFLWVLSNELNTFPTQCYRYNYITDTWTRGTQSKLCGGVNPVDDKLYLGNVASPIVDVERKTRTVSDYADYQSTQTVSGFSGLVVTITETDNILPGSVIFQSSTVYGIVASVDSVGGTVTMTVLTPFANGNVDVYSPIQTAIAWQPITYGNPGVMKQIRLATLIFKADFNGTAQVGFTSDLGSVTSFETIANTGEVGVWGSFGWGGPLETELGVPWGGFAKRRPILISVPRNQQRCSILSISFSHAFGFSPWLLQGLECQGNVIGERVST